jgi:hypothetical protein
MLTQSNKPTRGKALEEAFFYRMDQELIELLSKRLQRDEKIRLFANATGIRDRIDLSSPFFGPFSSARKTFTLAMRPVNRSKAVDILSSTWSRSSELGSKPFPLT